jgi:hypothetical protein
LEGWLLVRIGGAGCKRGFARRCLAFLAGQFARWHLAFWWQAIMIGQKKQTHILQIRTGKAAAELGSQPI